MTRPKSRPSYVIERGGRLYVRATYPDKSGRRSERRLLNLSQAPDVYVALKQEIEAKLKAHLSKRR